MLTKSGAAFLNRQTARQTKLAQMVQAHKRNFAGGGGPKKPSIPGTETDFDIVLVGKFPFNITCRWS